MKRIIILLAILITGCSTTQSAKDIAQDQLEAERIRAKQEQAKTEARQEKMEDALEQVPAWALEPPQSDSTGVYAVGISDSPKMQIALKKAQLEAEFGLAKIFNQELSGSERAYAKDDGSITTQYTELIDKLVDAVPVVGFEVVKQQVLAIDGAYNAFVLLKLPYDEMNKVLQQKKRETNDVTVKAAFDDLERRLQKHQLQRQLSEADAIKQGQTVSTNTTTD